MTAPAVLDSWAVLRHLEGEEPAASAVESLLADARPPMSWVNLGEVFYVVRCARGEDEAAEVVRDLRQRVDAELPTIGIVVSAGRIKADHRLALADAYAAATAMSHDGVLWTGAPELLVGDGPWQWRDLRTSVARQQ